MLLVGDAGVRLRPVADKFTAEADDEISRGMPGVAKKAAGFFAAAFAAVSIGKFLGNAISEATDLGENVSKVNVVFGQSAAQIEAFASTASTALGQSRNQALEAAGSFGSLFVGMGIGQQQAADMSTQMVTLASDMASFGNATPQEALDALRSGLVGEAEPLRRFGVMLNAAAIEQEAMRLGLMQSGGELTEAAKAQAVYSLAIQQTGIQAGDFGRTSEGLANQQRILKAQFTDVSTNIGGLFVPALANAANAVTGTVMPPILELTSRLPAMGDAIGTVGDMWRVGFADGPAAVNEATAALDGLPFTIGQVAGTAGDLGAIFREALVDGAAGSALLAEDSLQGFAARAGAAGSSIRGSLGGLWGGLVEGLAPVVGPLLGQLSAAFSTIGDTIGAAFGGAGGGGGGGGLATFSELIASLAEGALPLIIDYFTRWADVVAAVIPIIVTVIQGLVPVIQTIFAQIGPVLAQLAPIIGQVAGLFAGTLLTVIQALTPVIPPLVDAIGQVATVLAGAFMSVLQTLAPILPTLVGAIAQVATVLAGAFASALQAVLPILPVIADVIGQVATMFAGALADALQALLPILPPLAQALATIAQVLIGALMGALQAILPILPTLIGVFLQLIMSAIVPLLPLLPMLANLIAMILAAVAPLIPPLLQLVMVIIQLVVAAVVPLLPLLPIVIGLFTTLIGAIMPIVGILLGIVGGFISFASTVASVVLGFVSTVIGFFTSLWTGISRVVTNIVSGVTGGFQGLKDGIGDIFGGIADFVGGMFEGIGGAIKTAINGVIRMLNNTVIGSVNLLIDGVNLVNPFDDVPHIPKIPTMHTGGTFLSGNPSRQGFAFLRDNETVVTPEDKDRAAALLVAATGGRLPTATAAGTAGAGASIVIEEHLHMTEPTSPGEVAAQTSQAVAWNLRAAVTSVPGLTLATT